MKGPITGIVAIFLLQLGFISYTQVNAIFESTADVRPVLVQEAPLVTISDLDLRDSDEPNVEIAVLAPTRVSHGTRNVRSRRLGTTPTRVRTYFTDLSAVTISIPKPSPYTFASYERRDELRKAELPPRTQPDTNLTNEEKRGVPTTESKVKRSFGAKTLAVVRKPFDWLKALGSRLK